MGIPISPPPRPPAQKFKIGDRVCHFEMTKNTGWIVVDVLANGDIVVAKPDGDELIWVPEVLRKI